MLLPLNDITSSFGHVLPNFENQRVILSAKTEYPLTWKVSKIENTKPLGLIKVTMKETVFDPHTDYIEKDEDGNIIGMWADYYSSAFDPIELPEKPEEPKDYDHCHMSASRYSLKNNGSFRTVVCTYLNGDEEDVSNKYSDRDRQYFFEIDGVDVSEYVTYVVQSDKNIAKIKFDNSNYLGKILTVRTLLDYMFGEVQLEIL